MWFVICPKVRILIILAKREEDKKEKKRKQWVEARSLFWCDVRTSCKVVPVYRQNVVIFSDRNYSIQYKV